MRALVYLGNDFIVPGVSTLPFLFGIAKLMRFYRADVIMPQEKFGKVFFFSISKTENNAMGLICIATL